MSDSDNTQEPSDTPQEEQEAPQEEQEPVPTSAKAKRKPRQPREPKKPKATKSKSKVIAHDVGHTEYVDGSKPPAPPADILDVEPCCSCYA